LIRTGFWTTARQSIWSYFICLEDADSTAGDVLFGISQEVYSYETEFAFAFAIISAINKRADLLRQTFNYAHMRVELCPVQCSLPR
jgi:hypothetical protein